MIFHLIDATIYLEKHLNRIGKKGETMGFHEMFKALADPVRRDILILLKKRKMSAGEICEHFGTTNATISYHLSQLKKAGLIFEEKKKNFIFYQLNASVFEEIMLWISQFGGNNNEKEN